MDLSTCASRFGGAASLYFKQHGPTILTGVGVAGFAATTVLVGRAVLKSQPVVGALRRDTEKIMTKEITTEYTRHDREKEVGGLYMHQMPVLLKIYGPALVTGGVSIACVLGAHGMMRKQYTALGAAYVALDGAFKAYRGRVQEEIGTDRERQLYHGIRKFKTSGEDGEEVEACEIVDMGDSRPSLYSKFFDESNPNWSKTPDYNMFFLRSQESYANDLLRSRGHVFLNEIYDALAIPRTQFGQSVGWKLDGNGDGQIDFGIYDIFDECNRAFVNGMEPAILLDFNVDGPILID